MIYYKKVKDVLLLEDELKKLKATYTLVLEKRQESNAIADLRRMIKALTGRINKLGPER